MKPDGGNMTERKIRNDLARVKAVIESDRRNVSCDVEKMLKYDLMCVLGGYFEKVTIPQIEIKAFKGGVKVSVTLFAGCVRNSGVGIDGKFG